MALLVLVRVTSPASVVRSASSKLIVPSVVIALPLSVAVEALTSSAGLVPPMLGNAALPCSALTVSVLAPVATSLAMVTLPLVLVRVSAPLWVTPPVSVMSVPAVTVSSSDKALSPPLSPWRRTLSAAVMFSMTMTWAPPVKS